MSIAAQVRALPAEMSDKEVAQKIGVEPGAVWLRRYFDRHRERINQTRRIHDNIRLERTKRELGLGGIEGGVWLARHDQVLRVGLAEKQSYTVIGLALGVTRNAVAGRVHRLRQEGRL